MQVVVVGPNLLDQSKGSFHVHAAGCSHRRQKQYQSAHIQHDFKQKQEFATVQEVVEDVYQDQIAESDGTWDEYESDFWFAPCTEGLAKTATEEPKSSRAPYTLTPEDVEIRKVEDANDGSVEVLYLDNRPEEGEKVSLGLVYRTGDVENPRWFAVPGSVFEGNFQEVKKTLWTRKEALQVLVDQFNNHFNQVGE